MIVIVISVAHATLVSFDICQPSMTSNIARVTLQWTIVVPAQFCCVACVYIALHMLQIS